MGIIIRKTTLSEDAEKVHLLRSACGFLASTYARYATARSLDAPCAWSFLGVLG